jgi:hypothetical protein
MLSSHLILGQMKTPPFLTGFSFLIRFRDRNKVRTQLDADASEHNQLHSYA